MTCDSCKYWRPLGTAGQCHRYPQTVTKSPREWCGEHFPAPTVRIPVLDIMTEGLDKPTEASDIPKKRGRPRRIDQ